MEQPSSSENDNYIVKQVFGDVLLTYNSLANIYIYTIYIRTRQPLVYDLRTIFKHTVPIIQDDMDEQFVVYRDVLY